MTHSSNSPDPIEDLLATLRAEDPAFTDAELDAGFTAVLAALEQAAPECPPDADDAAGEPEHDGADAFVSDSAAHKAQADPDLEPPAEQKVPSVSGPQDYGATGREAAPASGDPQSRGTVRRSDGRGSDAGRPTRRFDLARALRTLTNVDESVLALVGHERSRYTALGAVVLSFTLISTLSIWSFATEALGRTSVTAWAVTIIWALSVLSLDRLLPAPQPNRRRRGGALLLRLAIALLIGTVVAEPLALRVFDTSVKDHIALESSASARQLHADLVRCNPAPPAPRTPDQKDCTSYTISYGTTTDALIEELTALRASSQALQERVDRDTAALQKLDSTARNECRQLVHHDAYAFDVTPTCHRLRDTAQNYRAIHHTGENMRRLAETNGSASRIEAHLTRARNALLKTRADAVRKLLNDQRVDQKPGVLERMQALNDLSGRDPVLLVAVWSMRLLLVLLGAAPLLLTSMGGQTTYDRLITSRRDSAVKMYGEEFRLAERRILMELEIEQHAINHRIQQYLAESAERQPDSMASTRVRVGPAGEALEDENRYPSSV